MTSPTKKNFPRSWKAWRKLRVGEILRYHDRVIFMHTSFAVGKCAGYHVTKFERAVQFPAGYYYRRTR